MEAVYLDALACSSHVQKLITTREGRLNRIDPATRATLDNAYGLAQYLEQQLLIINGRLDELFEEEEEGALRK